MEEHAQLVDAGELRLPTRVGDPRRRRRKHVLALACAIASMAAAFGTWNGKLWRWLLEVQSPAQSAGSATASTPTPLSHAGSSRAQVHVLLFESDQARPDAHNAKLTPHLDSLAREGARFTRAYSSTPICTPARLALLTGRGPYRHGMRSYQSALPPPRANRLELVATFAAHGYYCSVVGKNHYGLRPQSTRQAQGGGPATFETHGYHDLRLHEGLLMYDRRSSAFRRSDHYGEFFASSCPRCDPLATQPLHDASSLGRHNGSGEPVTDAAFAPWRLSPGATPYNSNQAFAYPFDERLHPTHWTAAMAVRSLDQWLSRRANGTEARPLFLKISFHRPHSPYDPPIRWLRALSAQPTAPAATSGQGGWDARYAGADGLKSCTASSRAYCGSGCGYQAYCGRLEDRDLAQVRAHYRASLAFVDEQAGRVLDRMRAATSEWRSTFVLYTSDHGDALGDHHLWRKGFAYEQVASIPLFVRWPAAWEAHARMPRGATISSLLVELRDVFPTLADAAGIPLPPPGDASGPDGRSVLPMLMNGFDGQSRESPPWRSALLLELAMCNFADTNWVALVDDSHHKYIRHLSSEPAEQLFDLQSDPYEQHDLLLAQPAAGRELLARPWRSRLASEFRREGRSRKWVTADGSLALSGAFNCSEYALTEAYHQT